MPSRRHRSKRIEAPIVGYSPDVCPRRFRHGVTGNADAIPRRMKQSRLPRSGRSSASEMDLKSNDTRHAWNEDEARLLRAAETRITQRPHCVRERRGREPSSFSHFDREICGYAKHGAFMGRRSGHIVAMELTVSLIARARGSSLRLRAATGGITIKLVGGTSDDPIFGDEIIGRVPRSRNQTGTG